jgi:hypothetical protein
MANDIPADSVQLATRIPKRVHRALKLECIATEVLVQDWVRDALEVHLRRCTGGTDAHHDGPRRALATLPRPARTSA